MKKKDLYKLVKQSLKEVLQEQRRDRRLGSDDFFVDPQTGELIPKDIAGAAISTATSAKPIKFKDDFINPFESGDDDVPTYTPSEADNPFTIWYVNTTTGECTEASVTDGYICDDGDADGYDDIDLFNDSVNDTVVIYASDGGAILETLNASTTYCADVSSCPNGNDFACFQSWASGQNADVNTFHQSMGLFSSPTVYSSLVTPAGLNNGYLTTECPACLRDSVASSVTNNANNFPANAVSGNNLALVDAGAPAGLSFTNDGSCVFAGCGVPYTDNHFCNEFPGICNGYTPNASIFAGVDGSVTCQYTGCIDVVIDQDYVCSLYNGALCDNAGPLGQPLSNIQGNAINYTQDNNVCLPNPGCTNNLFTAAYDSAYNVDDGSCVLDPYCGDNTSPSYICNSTLGTTLCNTQGPGGILNTTYIHFGANNTYGITDTSPLAPNEDNGLCGVGGCTDAGNMGQIWWDDNYAGQADSLSNETLPADYPGDNWNPLASTTPITSGGPGTGFIPINYNPAATEDDGSCQYNTNQNQNSDENPGWDWEEVPGCTDPDAVNYDENANFDDNSCVVAVPGCTDDGNISNNTSIYYGVNNEQLWWEGDPTEENYVDGVDDYETQTGIGDYPIIDPALNPGDSGYRTGPAVNFNSLANIDDGSCEYPQGCTDPNSLNYDEDAILDDGSCITAVEGCTVGGQNNPVTAEDNTGNLIPIEANNYNPNANVEDGSCTFTGCTLGAANESATQLSVDQNADQAIINAYDGLILSTLGGHTNAGDDNTNPFACTFEVCLDNTATNYVCTILGTVLCDAQDATGNPDSNLGIFIQATSGPFACQAAPVVGCMDNTAGYSGPAFDGEEYLQNPDVNGNGSYLAANYDPDANVEGVCYYYHCGDTNSYNYNANDPYPLGSNPGGNWPGGGDYEVDELCEYEGCNTATLNNISTLAGNASTEIPNPWTPDGVGVLYYYNETNTGCQTGTGGALTWQGPSGDLDPDDTDCCGLPGCLDNGNIAGANNWWTTNHLGNSSYQQQFNTTPVGVYPANIAAAGGGSPEFNANANVEDGSCTYPMGCTNSDAPNFDSGALIDDGSCLPACKKVKARQCNPLPDPNNYAPSLNFEYTIEFSCLHVDNSTPLLYREFEHMGVLYTEPGVEGAVGDQCPDFPAQNFGIQPPPFGAVGYPGQILTCGGVGSPQSQPMQGGSAACAGGLEGCTYIFGTTGKGNETGTNLQGGSSFWTLHPANTIQTYGGGKSTKATRIEVPAVFEIINVNTNTDNNIINKPAGSCAAGPKNPNMSSLAGFIDKPSKFQGPRATRDRKIREVQTSKKLRKSLKESLYGISSEDKLKKLIKNTLKKKK